MLKLEVEVEVVVVVVVVVVFCESSRPTSRQMTIVFLTKLIFTLFYLNYIIIVGLLINIRRNPTSLPYNA